MPLECDGLAWRRWGLLCSNWTRRQSRECWLLGSAVSRSWCCPPADPAGEVLIIALFWETWKLHKRGASVHCTYCHSSTLTIMIIVVTITTITIYIIITSHTMCLLSLHLVSCLMIVNDNTISNILFVKTILSNWYRASSSRRWRSCRGAPCKLARRTCIAGG